MIPVEVANQWRVENKYTTMTEINTGGCENFAQAMLHYFPDGELTYTEDYVCWDHCNPWPGGHCWIVSNGRHYDSEALDGVTNWTDIPFFKSRIDPLTIHRCNDCPDDYYFVKVSNGIRN